MLTHRVRPRADESLRSARPQAFESRPWLICVWVIKTFAMLYRHMRRLLFVRACC